MSFAIDNPASPYLPNRSVSQICEREGYKTYKDDVRREYDTICHCALKILVVSRPSEVNNEIQLTHIKNTCPWTSMCRCVCDRTQSCCHCEVYVQPEIDHIAGKNKEGNSHYRPPYPRSNIPSLVVEEKPTNARNECSEVEAKGHRS